MLYWSWRAMVIGAVIAVLIYSAGRPDPELIGLQDASIEQLIDQLGSSREDVLRAAASGLVSHGGEGIRPLVAALNDADSQQRRQIFLVLENLYLSDDQAVADAAEQALDQLLTQDQAEVRTGATEVIQANLSRRMARAYERVESFSGQFVFQFRAGGSTEERSLPDLVIINEDWTGGDDGLQYLQSVQGLRYIHIAQKAPLSESAIQQLKLASFSVRLETEGCLGVEIAQAINHLIVRSVVPNSPAERAGICQGDRLFKLNGESIQDYWTFQKLLHQLSPGSEVRLDVRREEEELLLVAKLGSDFGTGRCACQEQTETPIATNPSTSEKSPSVVPPSDLMTDNLFSPSGESKRKSRHRFRVFSRRSDRSSR